MLIKVLNRQSLLNMSINEFGGIADKAVDLIFNKVYYNFYLKSEN